MTINKGRGWGNGSESNCPGALEIQITALQVTCTADDGRMQISFVLPSEGYIFHLTSQRTESYDGIPPHDAYRCTTLS